ncbi:DUF6452 family protein [Postechiella marina]|uniref:DUF6452 family protein n=2 Tax=Postechiella marina TaxID=943941 RepID=A0ABP8BZQ4_9FLAO
MCIVKSMQNKMKYFKYIAMVVIALAICTTISCERDDICPESTPTTPRLIIDFYDVSIQENSKNVFGLVAVGVGNDNVLDGYAIVNTNNIILPLKTDSTATQYIIYKEYTYDDNDTPDDETDDVIGGNPDLITINYSTELVFVSRACGYKTIFNNVTISIEDDGDNWILSRESINDNQSVEDETATHFNLFH